MKTVISSNGFEKMFMSATFGALAFIASWMFTITFNVLGVVIMGIGLGMLTFFMRSRCVAFAATLGLVFGAAAVFVFVPPHEIGPSPVARIEVFHPFWAICAVPAFLFGMLIEYRADLFFPRYKGGKKLPPYPFLDWHSQPETD